MAEMNEIVGQGSPPSGKGDGAPLCKGKTGEADRHPTVFVVDDDADVRRTLDTMLRSGGFSASVFADGQMFLNSLRVEKPGCVLLDVRMPHLDGLQVQARLNELPYTLPVIMVSGAAEVPLAVQAMKRGAVDFLKKPLARRQLHQIVAAAIELDQQRRREWQWRIDIREKIDSLSTKEQVVLEFIAEGLLNKQIAARLDVSTRTIEMRRASIFRKLRVGNAGELMRFFYQARHLHNNDSSRSAPGASLRYGFGQDDSRADGSAAARCWRGSVVA